MHWYLFPFSIIYGSIVKIRNKLFDWEIKKSQSFDMPIISVGNVTVGGTGKTPHTEFLIEWLKDKYSIASLSRGYKRKTKGYFEVKTNSTIQEVGDEALQVKQKYPDIKVVVDEKRVHGVEKLIAHDNSPEIIILDDAFQHRYIDPGINILLIDYNRPITKDNLLPVGRLREHASNRKRASIIILTKCPHDLNPIDFRIMHKELNIFPYQNLFFTTFVYEKLRPVFNKSLKTSHISQLKGKTVLCVTGIANPEPLYREIENTGAKLAKLSFPDHHSFTKADTNKIFNKYIEINDVNKLILCTEKDAVRLKTDCLDSELTTLPCYYLPIKVKFLNNEENKFKGIISKFIGHFYN